MHDGEVAGLRPLLLDAFVRRCLLFDLAMVDLDLTLDEELAEPGVPQCLLSLHPRARVYMETSYDEVDHKLLVPAQHLVQLEVLHIGALGVVEAAWEYHLV